MWSCCELPTQLKDFALLHKMRNFLIISQEVTGVKIHVPSLLQGGGFSTIKHHLGQYLPQSSAVLNISKMVWLHIGSQHTRSRKV